MGPDQAAATVQSIAAHLRDHPFEHDGQLLPITVSTGIAFINKDTPDVDHVMLEADRAMYDCKAAGRGSTSGLRQPRTVHGPRTRVFHCDDSEAYRRLLTEMLTAHDDIEVKGGATTREEALRRVGDVDPDVIVLDALMHDNPSSFLAELKAHCPTSAVLVLSGLDICPAALAQGADGFIGKRRTFDDIADAIRAVMRTGRAVGEHP
jgi:PleD family two-component response regulator